MKTKLSVTVAVEVAKDLDRMAEGSSRSEIVERALVAWLREERHRRLEDDIERYYQNLTTEDLDEDESWAVLSHQSTSETWS